MKSFFEKFKTGLLKTSTSISRTLAAPFAGSAWTEETYKGLESALVAADTGPRMARRITDDIRERYATGAIKTREDIGRVALDDICSSLAKNAREINFVKGGLTVIMFAGVNGSGKTTSIGKLAKLWRDEGRKVTLCACDTFRAAAAEQLRLWAERTGSHIVSSSQGADPSSVAFDAVKSALSRGDDLLLIDTAGRQHTRKGLMEELSKMRRTIDKACPGAPHEVWLTVDAGHGSNSLSQAGEFLKSAGVTGLVLTKIDGTGKGGMIVAIQEEHGLPVFFAGFGEGPDDLQPFDPEFYARALLGLEK